MAKRSRQTFLKNFPEALLNESGAVFIGAGVSMGAGYPSWATLLEEIGDELGVNPRDVYDLAALAQWSIHESGGSRTSIQRVLRQQIAVEHQIPDSLKIISRLPLRQIWTTNYDRLIERAFSEINRPIDVISGEKDLSTPARPGAVRLHKMHGSIDRLDDIVISTDDYELFRKKRGAFLPLLQAHLTSMSMLFIGLSFSDPNIRHVLSLIRESFSDSPPEHYAIIRPPQEHDFDTESEFQAKSIQHKLWSKDLRRYGLNVVEVKNYEEISGLLIDIERRVARRRVWVSGSWPTEVLTPETTKNYSISEALGTLIGKEGMSLVSGAGLLVGSATISGFMSSLRNSGGWDLERRLIVRPFPQPIKGSSPDHQQWTDLRKELVRLSGVVIFVGGVKFVDGKSVVADGVMKEFQLAKENSSFLIPIGTTGGAAKLISEELIESNLPSSGDDAIRPTDEELKILNESDVNIDKIIDVVERILKRSLGRASKNTRYITKM